MGREITAATLALNSMTGRSTFSFHDKWYTRHEWGIDVYQLFGSNRGHVVLSVETKTQHSLTQWSDITLLYSADLQCYYGDWSNHSALLAVLFTGARWRGYLLHDNILPCPCRNDAMSLDESNEEDQIELICHFCIQNPVHKLNRKQ